MMVVPVGGLLVLVARSVPVGLLLIRVARLVQVDPVRRLVVNHLVRIVTIQLDQQSATFLVQSLDLLVLDREHNAPGSFLGAVVLQSVVVVVVVVVEICFEVLKRTEPVPVLV